MKLFDVLDIMRQLHGDARAIVGLLDRRRTTVASENDTRLCRHFECKGTQRFTTIAALGGTPGWECSEERSHVERSWSLDFSDEGRAGRIDAILSDLQLLEHQAADISDRNDKEVLNIQVRVLISRVQAERDRIKFPPQSTAS
jgi:hypothetical protein